MTALFTKSNKNSIHYLIEQCKFSFLGSYEIILMKKNTKQIPYALKYINRDIHLTKSHTTNV